jgi:hypothetical protein
MKDDLNHSLLCLGQFKSVRLAGPVSPATFFLTETTPDGLSRLLRFEEGKRKLHVVCSWRGDVTKFALDQKCETCTLIDTKVNDFQFGLGTVWQIDLTTGDRCPLLCERMIDPERMVRVVRALHRPVSDFEQASHLERYGILQWPTAVELLPDGTGYVVAQSKGILCVSPGQTPADWKRFPRCAFLNLTIIAHWRGSQFLLLETVRGAQGALWHVDVNSPDESPTFLAGGFREPSSLLVLPDRRHILLTETLPESKGRLWRLDLDDERRAELLREDLDRPGSMVLLSENSVAMVLPGGLRVVEF